MKPARAPRDLADARPMLVIDHDRRTLDITSFDSLSSWARPGDVWVLNDAATLPASLQGHLRASPVELRLAAHLDGSRFQGVLFGSGSWRDDTDHRPPPPRAGRGDNLHLGPLNARVTAVDECTPRLIEVEFDAYGADLWSLLFSAGRPVQYSYMSAPLHLADVQVPYAGKPWAMEMPSAGQGFSARMIGALRERGASVTTLTHAAGLSATGDPELDARLPLPERYEISMSTAAAINAANRVVAVGTSVVRALESSFAAHGRVEAETRTTDRRIGPKHRLAVVDALLTGAHDPSSSHHGLLGAFLDAELLGETIRVSDEARFLGHEFGDRWLIL